MPGNDLVPIEIDVPEAADGVPSWLKVVGAIFAVLLPSLYGVSTIVTSIDDVRAQTAENTHQLNDMRAAQKDAQDRIDRAMERITAQLDSQRHDNDARMTQEHEDSQTALNAINNKIDTLLMKTNEGRMR